MLLLEHIDSVRTRVKQTSDDTQYPDRFIYNILKQVRSYLTEQRLRKGHKASDWLWQCFCIGLELTTYHDCSCLPEGACKIHKSTVKLPKPLRNKFQDMIKVTNTEGTFEYNRGSALEFKRNQHTRSKVGKPTWDIVNGYLVIFGGNPNLKAVYVCGIWDDPTELAGISACDVFGNTTSTPCFDPATQDFPMDSDLTISVHDMTVERLTHSQQHPEDLTNNTQSPTGQKT